MVQGQAGRWAVSSLHAQRTVGGVLLLRLRCSWPAPATAMPQLIRQCSTAMLSLRHCSTCSGCWTVVECSCPQAPVRIWQAPMSFVEAGWRVQFSPLTCGDDPECCLAIAGELGSEDVIGVVDGRGRMCPSSSSWPSISAAALSADLCRAACTNAPTSRRLQARPPRTIADDRLRRALHSLRQKAARAAPA